MNLSYNATLNMENQIIKSKAKLNISSNPLIIYGAGNFGKDLCQIAQKKRLQVVALLDQKAVPGQLFQGVSVLLPNSKEITTEIKENSIVLVALHNRETDLVPVISSLKKTGFKQVLNPVEYYDLFLSQFEDRFWLTSPSTYQKWQDDISKGYSIWEDESSKSLYLSLLTHRIGGDYSVLPSPDLTGQYFPSTVPPWKYPLRFVDCGAFDGDSLRQIGTKKIAIENVVAFEPDLQNFDKLSYYIKSEWNSPAMLFPCGVHSTTDRLKFASSGGESGKLNEKGNTSIQVVALDDALHGFHPNLIKMDIEGAELEALLGAQKIISQNRPGLAICVYHCPQHLWQIPDLVKQWNLGYKFYLRAHGHNGFEVVMYAVQS